ncbi:MAG: VWA domain-containing protein, partial [Pollutimonas bauzanensis]
MMPRAFSDYRFWLLLGALCLALWACLRPQWRLERARAQVLFVVDITRSMNVRDYAAGAQQRSRLEQAKDTVTQALARMPCGSRAGLGVFTERRSFLLLEPMETCANYAALSQTVAELNWRMAGEGDSRIASGLFGALELADTLGANLVFVTDGQEAPPLPASGRPQFEGEPGKVR